MDKHTSLESALNDQKYRGIVFDFDGTLFDLDVDWGGMKAALERLMKTAFDTDMVFSPLSAKILELRTSGHPAYREAIGIIEEYELKGLAKGRPNQVLLDYVRSAGAKPLGIYTMNTYRTIDAFLRQHDLMNRFTTIISQDNSHGAKPNAVDLKTIAEGWSYPPESILFIGNSSEDRESGALCGVTTILVP